MDTIKINRTEYIHLVSEKLNLTEDTRTGVRFNSGMIVTFTFEKEITTLSDQLRFINNHIEKIFGTGYDLTSKDLLINKKDLFVSSRDRKTALNLFGLYDALVRKGHIEPNKKDDKIGYIYRVEDKNSRGPYQRPHIKNVEIMECNPPPKDDLSFCSFLYSRLNCPITGRGTTISKGYLFGFKDITSLKRWFLKNNELNQEVSVLNFNIVKIKINKNNIIQGNKQIMFNSDKILDKSIVGKYKNLSSLTIRKKNKIQP
jgi:hypothetical protein